jgi:predicted nucleic acid-binding protein
MIFPLACAERNERAGRSERHVGGQPSHDGSSRINVVATVTRFVIDSGTALYLAADSLEVSPEHELLAPTLWRSETLSAMYEAVRRGEITAEVARERLAYINRMKIRVLGDAMLRRRAWKVADQLGLPTTYEAEYVALAQLQKCTLVSTNKGLLKRVRDLVPTASVDALR